MATLRRIFKGLRPWVAMAAAQALALQLLLLAFTAGQVVGANPADGSLFVICHSEGSGPAPGDDGSKAPGTAHHAPCVLCSLAAGTGAISPTTEAYLPFRLAAAASYEPAQAATAVTPRYTPRSSQGPPANA